MDYTSAVEFLRDLKNNTYHFNIRQRMKMLLVVIYRSNRRRSGSCRDRDGGNQKYSYKISRIKQ